MKVLREGKWNAVTQKCGKFYYYSLPEMLGWCAVPERVTPPVCWVEGALWTDICTGEAYEVYSVIGGVCSVHKLILD